MSGAAQRGLQEGKWPRVAPLERLWTSPPRPAWGDGVRRGHHSLGQGAGHQALGGF